MSLNFKTRGKRARERVYVQVVEVDSKLLTRQEFKLECDINQIVKQAERTLQPPAWVNRKEPQFGDFSKVPSLAEAYELVSQAEDMFMELPSKARLELGNDPRRLLEADAEFFKRHGLTRPVEETSPNGPPGGPGPQSGPGEGSKGPKAPEGKPSRAANKPPVSRESSGDDE